MRGARAKSIRKYVARSFPFLPQGALYKQRPDGVIELVKQCSRYMFQHVKDNYKRKKHGLEIRDMRA